MSLANHNCTSAIFRFFSGVAQVCRKISALFVPNLLAAISADLRRTGTKLSQSGGVPAGIPAKRYLRPCRALVFSFFAEVRVARDPSRHLMRKQVMSLARWECGFFSIFFANDAERTLDGVPLGDLSVPL